MDGLSTAIDQMAAAAEGWKAAKQAAAGSQKELTFAQFRLDTQNQQAMANLADEVKKEIDQKLSNVDLTAEFEGLMRERMPVGGVSKEKQDAAFQFVRKMTDHFETLNPQDQRTMIDLTKKYRAGSMTEDELKTLNKLNPDFVLDLSMPKDDGVTISAPQGDIIPYGEDLRKELIAQRDSNIQLLYEAY